MENEKDNLTDVAEIVASENTGSVPNDGQVYNDGGDVVTLGDDKLDKETK